jgi:rare lipoprotein A
VNRRDIAKLAAVLCLGTGAALPASGAAQDTAGGAAYGTQPPSGGTAPTAAPDAGTAGPQRGILLGHTLRFRGSVGAGAAGRRIAVERLDPSTGWVSEASVAAGADGVFTAAWTPHSAGRYTVRAVSADDGDAHASAAPVLRQVTVYRPARATWYGPGFYGRKTACGQVMSHALLGVAHRSLPCGAPVEVFYRGRTITVPVVDRGPFANGARYDLTSATAQALGFTQTATVGVVGA